MSKYVKGLREQAMWISRRRSTLVLRREEDSLYKNSKEATRGKTESGRP